MIREIDEPNTDIKAPSNISQIEAISYLQLFNRDAGKSLIKNQRSTPIKKEMK